jgi:hypothetical protein
LKQVLQNRTVLLTWPKKKNEIFSVADPGCLSRILIFTHSGSRIPDPKSATKERGEKKLVVKPFFVATNFCSHKSGIRDPEKPIPDPGPGVKKAPDPDPQHWKFSTLVKCLALVATKYFMHYQK